MENKVSLEDLQALGKEMQEKVGFEPPIKFDSNDEKVLLDDIKFNATDLDADKDRQAISAKSKRTLKSLGLGPWKNESAPAPSAEKPKAKEEPKAEPEKAKEKGGKQAMPPKTATQKVEKKEKKTSSRKDTPRDFSKSNKAIVYGLWKKGKGETDPEKLAKAVKGAVKTTTIAIWIHAWGRGKDLPAIANK